MVNTTNTTAINGKRLTTSAPAATTINQAGAPAWSADKREATLRYLMLGGLGDTYYADEGKITAEADVAFRAASLSDPEFFADAIVYAREKGFMRDMPIRALAWLSMGDTDARNGFGRIFNRVVRNVRDLQKFTALCNTETGIRGVGRKPKSAVEGWLAEVLDEHGVIKYGSDKQTRGQDAASYSLRDLYRVWRPTLFGKANALAKYVVKGEGVVEEIPQIGAYLRMKEAASNGDLDAAIREMREARLPWNVLTGAFASTKGEKLTTMWRAALYQMPYQATLRNLISMSEAGVFEDDQALSYVTKKLADPEQVGRSMLLPHQFLVARAMIERARPAQQSKLMKALTEAIKASRGNVPDLGVKVGIYADGSGSMDHPVVRGGKNQKYRNDIPVTCADLASVIAAGFYLGQKTIEPRVAAFSDSLFPTRGLTRADDIISAAKKIHRAVAAGTSIYLAVEDAIKHDCEVAIIMTDSETWANEGYGSTNRTTHLVTEQRKKNPNFKVFFIQLAPNTTRAVPSDISGVFYFSGYSDDMVNYISTAATSATSQLANVIGYSRRGTEAAVEE